MNGPKDIVRDFLATFSTGHVEQILERLTDDATWWVSGRIPGMSGTSTKAELGEILRQVVPLYKKRALQITPLAMIAEGPFVAVEAESCAELVDGRVYANQYHFLFEVADGRVRRVKEYSDTQHMLETFSG